MSSDLQLVLVLLLGFVALLVAGRPRMDAVALLAVVVLPLSGILTVPEALAGFSDPSVVLIAALFVIGEGLVRTGVAYRLGDFLLEKAGSRESRLLVLLMLSVAGLGAVMSSTGVVAIFIPVVLGLVSRLGIAPGRLMMPLSFAGLISGMLTLVATPPNMILDSALRRAGAPGFAFFDFTPIGLVVLLAGVAYMTVARRWLSDRSERDRAARKPRRNLRDLVDQYQLAGRGHALRVRARSPLVGQTLESLGLRHRHHLNVIGILREGRLREDLLSPTARTELCGGDVLLVDATDGADAVPAVAPELGLDVARLRGSYFTDESREVGMAEVLVPPDSSLIGRSVRASAFRSKRGLNVVGLRRDAAPFAGAFLEEPLRLGDTLLVIGPWKRIRQLRGDPRELLVLTLPVELDWAAPALGRAPLALASLLVMVLLMVSGLVPNVLAVLLACLLMGLFGCVDLDGAYRSIHWPTVIVIVGMMPFAAALQKTGGVALAVDGLLDVFGGGEPRILLAALFVATATIGLFVSNTATAVLMAPVALDVAARVGASPRPFAMVVALAASAAFMTPVSSPVNTLVHGPGEYRFVDFVKVGVPFTALVLLIALLLVPWLFPFA